MDRPPRAVPPSGAAASSYNTNQTTSQPQRQPLSPHGISFQEYERGDRAGPLPFESRQQRYSAAMQNADYEDGSLGAKVGRKRSLVRPDRERIDPNHRQYHYRNHAAQLEEQGSRLGVLPSATGNLPMQPQLRRGKSLLARGEHDNPESGLALFKRGATIRRRFSSNQGPAAPSQPPPKQKKGFWDHIGPGPKDAWMIYCWILTCCVPPFLLSTCGMKTPEQQRAWREKMGLLFIIAILMGSVGFLTFGFTQTVCGKPPVQFRIGNVDNNSVIIHGHAYNLATFNHPRTAVTFNGTTNPLRDAGLNIAGQDLSFMFQNVNGTCNNFIKTVSGSSIPNTGGSLHWYAPCNPFNQFGTSSVNKTGYDSARLCHASSDSRSQLSQLSPSGMVAYTWEDVMRSDRNLAVYESSVLDFSLLNWLDRTQVNYTATFDEMRNRNDEYAGKDITMYIHRTRQVDLANCLESLVRVGFIDTKTIGCVASDVVLILSLVFIIGVVAIRFFMAVLFGWFLSWRLGNFAHESYQDRMRRAAEIEQWTDDIYRPAPARLRPNANARDYSKPQKKSILPVTSRFSRADMLKAGGGGGRPVATFADPYSKGRPSGRPNTLYSSLEGGNRKSVAPSVFGGKSLAPPDSPFKNSRSSTSLPSDDQHSTCPFPLYNVVPQPPPDEMPFGFPLAHTICLVTAYSETPEGLRTTLDSLATTDYPNSHKVLMVIADGVVKGQGNDMTTPDIVLSMMKELVIPKEEVQAHSYVAIADGHKRHNMAKVYAGWYDYDSNTVEPSKQQRVPMVLVAKVGNPLEATEAKPGNRGKRDSQIVLMAFLQKIMFDERMTTFEYEFFNSLWRCTGVCPDRYELVLCVDADTKVFPDSLTRMCACMVNDTEIMGLCGETKIANKADSWVTMIQVFEYYISHHLTKAFESMFGGVTCLPGCFSMYRIKAPKTDPGYWVPILANPDVVEHYSENVVDTLHKKNLLLLGEDRYLTTLMLKTFPKRKMLFCPQAVCKTQVPDTFSVLLSQRRRWINSTIHNLAELLLVRDLCGTFCFSMQFVVFMELAGTLVLPAAITFTFYLIGVSIRDGAQSTLIPLVLLGIILGLPGLLIVVTSRKVAYVGWMFIYLLSLPVWNLVLPSYAFWHFDDFSWGQTRKVSGEKAGGNHGDKEGEFDSSHIVMKRWAEFERERRFKTGTHSRDSTYVDALSPRGPNARYSMASIADTYDPYAGRPFAAASHTDSPDGSPHGYPRSRPDTAPLLMLPAPLAISASQGTPSVNSSLEGAHMHPVAAPEMPTYNSEYPAGNDDRDLASPDATTSLMSGSSGRVTSMGPGAVMRNVPGHGAYTVENTNPYRHSQGQVATTYEQPQVVMPTPMYAQIEGSPDDYAQQHKRQQSRGVSLVDNGPVGGDVPVRRVARQSKRISTQAAPRSRQSSLPPGPTGTPGGYTPPSHSNSGSPSMPYAASPPPHNFSLPPGAAPPQPYNPNRYQ